jgi:hypothetical protein
MPNPPEKGPIHLDYSSLAEEQRRVQQAEEARSKALGDYNESTFGARHPFSIYPYLIYVVIACTLIWILPRWAARIVGVFSPLIYIFWEAWRRR